jgi:hypothetical protein
VYVWLQLLDKAFELMQVPFSKRNAACLLACFPNADGGMCSFSSSNIPVFGFLHNVGCN